MNFITEPAKQIPVYADVDVCVVGGSATGVFAAVRAARLGAKVLLIEKQNSLGGTATNSLVSVWHSYNTTDGKKQIIAGLTEEVTDRLHANGSEITHFTTSEQPYHYSHKFNPNEMKIELDMLLKEAGVKVLFHTMYCSLATDGNRITHIFIENKDGRSAVRAKFFIDASGDGDLARDLGIESYRNPNVQPPSPTYLLQGLSEDENIGRLIAKYPGEADLAPDWGWSTIIPGLDNLHLHSDTHIFNVDCSKADDLTYAEIEGRRQIRECLKLIRNHGDPDTIYGIAALCSQIGIRDTVHYKTSYKATQIELMLGTRYEDNIVNGTYVGDVHLAGGGIMFMGFDGTYRTENPDTSIKYGNWHKEMNVGEVKEIPTYYSLPFRALVGEKYENYIAVGRMMHADVGAFGALRVMVNLNQMGEAAGVASYLALHHNCSVQQLDGVEVAKTLSKGGSANLL